MEPVIPTPPLPSEIKTARKIEAAIDDVIRAEHSAVDVRTSRRAEAVRALHAAIASAIQQAREERYTEGYDDGYATAKQRFRIYDDDPPPTPEDA